MADTIGKIAVVVTLIGGIVFLASGVVLGLQEAPCAWCCFWHPEVILDPGSGTLQAGGGVYGTGISLNVFQGVIGVLFGLIIIGLAIWMLASPGKALYFGIAIVILSIIPIILDSIFLIAGPISLVGALIGIAGWSSRKQSPR